MLRPNAELRLPRAFFLPRSDASRLRIVRLAALSSLGVALGAGGAVLTVSLVQAEGDGWGVREFHMQEHKRIENARRAAAPAPKAAPVTYYAPAAYAPSRLITLPLFQTNPDGRLAAPAVNLNPFKKVASPQARKKARKGGHTLTDRVALDVVSGSANVARTICVRLCDGFHAPIGYLAASSDLPAHEALCKAMNPGVPVKVFKVAAGAQSIDEATAVDGKTYGVLPMAYSHEKSADPACRPRITGASERRVSILKDFTLRPGDSVVVEGSARVFSGAQAYPFSAHDFRDFRATSRISDAERRKIDNTIGLSFQAAAARAARNAARLREANLSHSRNFASDVSYSLRGAVTAGGDVAYYGEGRNGPVRMIAPHLFGNR
jgi:hypothetical protein